MLLRCRLIAMLIALLVCGVAAQNDSPHQVQVSPGTSQGLLVYKVQPSYPPLARQARVQGTVVLRALVGKDGTIADLSVISGHPMLIQAAMDAVKQWRYKPYLLNGEPALVQTTINMNFELNGPASEAPPNSPAANSSSSNSGSSSPPLEEESDLKPYTTCNLGPEFKIVQVDGPVTDFAWPVSTKNGEVRIPVEAGFRVLVTYMETEPFGNLKVERLPKSQYIDEKANLLSSLEYLAAQPGNAPVQTDTRNGLTMYGHTRNKLEGGTLSIYYLFLDQDSVAVSMYLLNAEPAERKFNTLDEFKKIRDRFLDAYTKCLAPFQKSVPSRIGASSETPSNEPAANRSSSESGNSNPLTTPQVVQTPSSDQYPGAYRVGGDVSAPKATYAPDPQYSEKARKAHYEGAVVLWLVVDADGLPQKIRVQRSLGMGLDEEAVKALRQWRFQPAEKDGKPVPVMINVEVNFKLFSLAPPPANQEHPPRFPGVDAVTYPLVVRVTSHFRATITEAGKERRVVLSCKPEGRTCGDIEDGTYPAKWIDGKNHIEILGLEDKRSDKWETLDYTVEAASSAVSAPDRTKGISLHMLPKRVADLGPYQWGLVVSHAGDWKPPQQPPVFQTTQDFLLFVRAQNQQVQENGVWIVVTDPDAYSDAEKTFLEDVKALCRKEKIPLFISRAIDLPNGWKRYDE